MKKKVISLILAVSMVTSMTACGSSGGGTTNNNNATSQTETPSEKRMLRLLRIQHY